MWIPNCLIGRKPHLFFVVPTDGVKGKTWGPSTLHQKERAHIRPVVHVNGQQQWSKSAPNLEKAQKAPSAAAAANTQQSEQNNPSAYPDPGNLVTFFLNKGYYVLNLKLGQHTDRMDENLTKKSVPLGYASGINGANAGIAELLKRPKQGLEYHLFNVAAMLAGVGLGGDVRCSTGLQSTRPKKYFDDLINYFNAISKLWSFQSVQSRGGGLGAMELYKCNWTFNEQ